MNRIITNHQIIFNSIQNIRKMNTTFNQLFYNYMARGIIQSKIVEDGGLQCYQEIPYEHHVAFVAVLSIIHLGFIFKWGTKLIYHVGDKQSTPFQRRFAIVSFLSWLLTLLFKLKTQKGLFMLNPCHITILIQIYLMFNKNTKFNRIVYAAWSGWLFGPYMATLIPHLNGIDTFEVILYYFEHIAIIPFGYLILNNRYGFLKPTLKNHLPAFSTIALYQFWVLVPFSRSNMVNLNFALCHSPADLSFEVVGPYYFVVCTLFLNIFSYLTRWVSYFQIIVVYKILSVFGLKSPKIVQYDDQTQYLSVETPGKPNQSKRKA